MDRAAQIAKARKAGYSDAEIVSYLGNTDAAVRKAKAVGYGDKEIVGFLEGVKPKPKPTTRDTVMDSVKGYASGLKESLTGMIPQVTFGGDMVLSALHSAADVAGTINSALSGAPSGVKAIPRFGVGGATQLATNAGGPSYQPTTTAGRVAKTAGAMSPNALAPGSALQRTASVVFPTIGSEGAGALANASGAGKTGEAIARTAGALGGGLAASTRLAPRNATASITRGQDAGAMRSKMAEYQASGIEPTLVDVADDSARGVVRAAATKMTPGRQAATDFRDARALDLPSRMSSQARRVMSSDPRTPDAIRAEMTAQRSANADQAFGAVRGDTIPLADETVSALRTDYGRKAISEAASRERDPEIRAALNRLANDAFDNPGQTNITIGMADRVSRVLKGQGQAAARGGDNELAKLLNDLGENIRGPARQASTGYASALEGYGADSRLAQAADVGESLLTRNTDEFVSQASALSGPERDLALAAGRRAIERASGESVAAAPGVARKLSTAPEQLQRNSALMGQDRATQLQAGMRLEERALQNANEIAPKIGSKTAGLTLDLSTVAQRVIDTGQKVARGDLPGLAMDWLKSRGMSDSQAEAIVRLAIDPAQTERAIMMLEQQAGPKLANDMRRLVMAATATSALSQLPTQTQ